MVIRMISMSPVAYLFVDPSENKTQGYIDALKPVASKHRGKVNFVWIDATKFGDHTKALNLAEAKWPNFVVQNLESQLKYPYDQSKDVEAAAVCHGRRLLGWQADAQVEESAYPRDPG